MNVYTLYELSVLIAEIGQNETFLWGPNLNLDHMYARRALPEGSQIVVLLSYDMSYQGFARHCRH